MLLMSCHKETINVAINKAKKWVTVYLMIIFFIFMTNVLSSSAFSSLIMSPVKAIATIPAVRRFLEFRNNIGYLWSGKTTMRTRVTVDPRENIFRLPHRSLPLRFYNLEPFPKNPNVTEVYRKNMMLFTPPKKVIFKRREIFELPLKSSENQKAKISDTKKKIDTRPKINALLRGRIIASGELDPRIHPNGMIVLDVPRTIRRRHRWENTTGILKLEIPYLKNIVSYGSSYPGCYTASRKLWPLLGRYEPAKKLAKRSIRANGAEAQVIPTGRIRWPLLGANNQVYGPRSSIHGAKDSLSPHFDRKRWNQMLVISKLSEMKAKEHIAGDNRVAEMHKTQEAKKEFQERIGEQLDLLSQAKRADLRAKRAFEKVVKLERSLSEQDREIHRLKEFEDQLYEELLETEAEVAFEDIQLIPKFLTEEDLQEFMTGTKLL